MQTVNMKVRRTWFGDNTGTILNLTVKWNDENGKHSKPSYQECLDAYKEQYEVEYNTDTVPHFFNNTEVN